jgi:hypothetical protein
MLFVNSSPERDINPLARASRRESQSGNSQEDGNDIRQIEGHSSQGENCIHRSWTSKVQKARKDSDQSGDPDHTDGGSSVIVHHREITTIRETFIAAESIHSSRTSLEDSLDDEESGKTYESPEEEGSGFSNSQGHDLIPSEWAIRSTY